MNEGCVHDFKQNSRNFMEDCSIRLNMRYLFMNEHVRTKHLAKEVAKRMGVETLIESVKCLDLNHEKMNKGKSIHGACG